jgi:hypothetical protein
MRGRRHIGHIKRASPAGALIRPVDRYEVRLHRWMILIVAIAAAIPVLAGVMVWNAAAPHGSPAVISPARAVTDTPAPSITAQTMGAPLESVHAHWEWNGRRHDGVIAVPSGTPAGAGIPINVDENGNWVGEVSAAEKRMYGTTAAVVLSTFLAMLLIAVARERSRQLLERRQEHYWTENLRRFFATLPD